MHRFRFGVIAAAAGFAADWVTTARRAEELGYAALPMPDHPGPRALPGHRRPDARPARLHGRRAPRQVPTYSFEWDASGSSAGAKIIGRFPGRDLLSHPRLGGHGPRHRRRRGLDLTLPERHQIAAIVAARSTPQTEERIA